MSNISFPLLFDRNISLRHFVFFALDTMVVGDILNVSLTGFKATATCRSDGDSLFIDFWFNGLSFVAFTALDDVVPSWRISCGNDLLILHKD